MAGVVLTNDELCDELDCPRGSSLTWDKNGSGSWLLRITSENLPQKFEAGPNSMLKCTTLAKWRGQRDAGRREGERWVEEWYRKAEAKDAAEERYEAAKQELRDAEAEMRSIKAETREQASEEAPNSNEQNPPV